MRYLNIEGTELTLSNIVIGNMRISSLGKKAAEKLFFTVIEEGINFFDHADIYGGGECEKLFGEILNANSGVREKIFIQSKCSIVTGDRPYYDFSKEHILQSVDGSLKRLGTDYLDVLLLHRPDTLFEPEEVAEAFDLLEQSGKVRYFGVSNQNSWQVELLQKYVRQKLIFNQLQLSVVHTPMIDAGMTVNMADSRAIDRTGGILEYSRLKDMTVQAWSPFQKGFFEGCFIDDDSYPLLNEYMAQLADKYGVTKTSIAVSFITRHPANMQVITGTTNPDRIRECAKGSDIPLTREEWYTLYRLGGGMLP